MIKGPASCGFIALICSALLLAGTAHSAVRACGGFIDSPGLGQTEKQAKKQALDGWMKQAAARGMEQVRWQLAADRSLLCQESGGVHRCRARARPCVIKQVPPKVPGERRDVPKERGI